MKHKPREKRCKLDINYNFSEKTTMTIATETVLCEDITEKA